MNSISNNYASRLSSNAESINELEAQHFAAVQLSLDWQDVWGLFYRSPWFRYKLTACAREAARRGSLGKDAVEDIKQESLVEFAKALQRNPSLGFDRDRGDFHSYLSTILHRCSLKSLRMFRQRFLSVFDDEFLHPYYEHQSQIEKVIDFRHVASRIPEPYRGIVVQICAGQSIESIARDRKRSVRTIYRWLDRAIDMLKTRYFED
jgi:DNA-directed RNA polymerase specialized sigma24 family protein